jgi:hypothetical protein
MAIDKDQVKQLLGAGLDSGVVASAVGCDPSYIIQLLGDDNFRNEVAILRTKNLTAHNERDRKIDSLEDTLLDKLEEIVNYIHKPTDLLRAFTMINSAKRRGVQSTAGAVPSQAVVKLTIPVVVMQKFVTNKQGEVIEIEGQTMVTMPSHQLLRNLAAQKGGESNEYENVARYLPGTTTGDTDEKGS